MPQRPLAALVCLVALLGCGQRQQAPEQEPAPPHGGQIVIETPQAGLNARSALALQGAAPNQWCFEAQFPAILVGEDGRVIAEAPARAETDWTEPGDVRFRAQLAFVVTEQTPATLVLQEDMPSGLSGEREVRIPVVLSPPLR